MRLTILLALTLLAAGTVGAARAEDVPNQSIPMPSYADWMDICYADYSAQQGQDKLAEEVVAGIVVQCQCEFSQMPGAGITVSLSMVKVATDACHAEYDTDNMAYKQKYLQQLKDGGLLDE